MQTTAWNFREEIERLKAMSLLNSMTFFFTLLHWGSHFALLDTVAIYIYKQHHRLYLLVYIKKYSPGEAGRKPLYDGFAINQAFHAVVNLDVEEYNSQHAKTFCGSIYQFSFYTCY